jgi:hypothetical protein
MVGFIDAHRGAHGGKPLLRHWSERQWRPDLQGAADRPIYYPAG